MRPSPGTTKPIGTVAKQHVPACHKRNPFTALTSIHIINRPRLPSCLTSLERNMDVLTAEAIYQQENRKSGLLKVFHPQRGSLSLSQLFSKSKVLSKGRGIQSQVENPLDRSSDFEYVVRALCGGVEATAAKASIPKSRNLTINEAIGLVEQTAVQLAPDMRERVLQTWCTILAADQGCAATGPGDLSPAIKARYGWNSSTSSADEATAAAAAAHTAGTEQDVEPATGPKRGTAADTTEVVQNNEQCLRQQSSGSGITDPSNAKPPTAPVLHLTLLDDNKPVEISFRELFLKSMALELVVKNFLEEPSTDTEEILLHQLFQLCLSKEPAEQSSALVDAIIKLSSSMLHPHIQALPRNMLWDIVSQAVGSLKAPADLDKLDRQMEVVQEQLTTLQGEWNDCDTQDQAGSLVANTNECMDGLPPLLASTEPLQESLRWKIAQQAWELASELKGLATQRHAILEHQAAFDYSTLRKMVDEPAASVGADVTALQQQVEETQSQLQQGAGFRTERFGKVKEQLVGMASEISSLEARRAVLLAELEKVEDELRRLYKRQSELEEERNMFEEGSSLTLEGLTVQVSALEATQAVALMEATTLRNASALVALAELSAANAASSTLRLSEECRQAATDKVLAAAQRFCKLQELELSRCVSAMKESAAEIADISSTQMYDDILHQQALEAVEARRQAAIETYLDAEMAAMGILGELAQVQDSVRIQYRSLARLPSASCTANVEANANGSMGAQPDKETADLSTSTLATSLTTAALPHPNGWPAQLATLMPALESLRAEFESFDRPDEVTKYSMAKAISSVSSRHLSASLSRLGAAPAAYDGGQLTPRSGSSKLLAGASGQCGGSCLEAEHSNEDLPATCDTNHLISYTALMEVPDVEDSPADEHVHRADVTPGSRAASQSSSPDRQRAAAVKKAAAGGAGGGHLRNCGGSSNSRAGSDLDLQGLDNDSVAA